MNQLKRILVPVDYSDNSRSTLLYAIEFAREVKAKLIIFHAFYIQIPTIEGEYPMYSYEAYSTYMPPTGNEEQFSEDLMRNFTDEFPELNEVEYERKVMSGTLEDLVPEVIRNLGIDLVIMGTKGATGLKEVLFGSNTVRVIENTDQPVLTIPDQTVYKRIEKIAFALDTKHADLIKQDVLKQFAHLFSATIDVVYVQDPSSAEKIRTGGIEGVDTPKVILNEDVEKGLYNYINLHNIDLLAIISHKHGFLRRLFKSSMTRKIAYHIKIPLLAL